MRGKTNIIVISLVLYVISTLLSFTAFSMLGKMQGSVQYPESTPESKNGSVVEDTLPKTEPCPLNGALYSKKQRERWEARRPLGVMIENHQESRPQSGLSDADVVYEAVAEGGITRFLTVFYCQDPGTVGAVRSARTYFLDFVSEYGEYPLYTHVGGANTPGPADALGQIERYGWQTYNDLNQFSIGFPTFKRDYERLGHPVATEHAMYASSEELWKVAKGRGLTNKDKKGNPWNTNFTWYSFKDDMAVSQRPESQVLTFDFWKGYTAYSVRWEYDKTQNSYKRFNGGQSHLDKNNEKQLMAKTVVILFMTETNAYDGYEDNAHLLYGTKGKGSAAIFMDGRKTDGTWTKKDRTSRTIIGDENGQEIVLSRGLLWFEIVPKGTILSIQ